MEAQAQMKYHSLGTLLHLSNEETNGFAQPSGWAPSGFGIMGRRLLSRIRDPGAFGPLVIPSSACRPSEDPTVVKTAPIAWDFIACARVLFRDICQMGSLAGAAYLLHDNAGVLRRAQ